MPICVIMQVLTSARPKTAAPLNSTHSRRCDPARRSTGSIFAADIAEAENKARNAIAYTLTLHHAH